MPPINWVLPLALFFLVLSIPYAVKAGDHASAFVRWRNQIELLFTGEDIYLRHGYPNPPIMALLLYPLVLLPPVVGALLWYYLKAGMALLAISWTFRLVEDADRPFPLVGQWLVVLLALRPMMGDLMHGNVNLFILFLLVGVLLAYRRGRDMLAGVTVALAIACKVTPALFVPYLLWKRSWRALAGCGVGLVLFFLLIPAVFLGWQRNVDLLHSWMDFAAAPYVVEGRVLYTAHNNQSLPALVLRLTTASPSYTTYVDEQLAPAAFHNLLELEPATAHWFVRCLMLLFAGGVAWSCRTARRDDWRMVAEAGLIVLGMLLFSERTWKHHCVILLVPFAVLVYQLTSSELAPRMRRYLIATLVACWVLMAATGLGRAGELAEVYGVYVAAFVLLAMALVVMLRLEPTSYELAR